MVKPIVAGEVLRPFADEEVVISVVHDELGDLRRRPHALDLGDAARALSGTVHAAGVELHHSIRIRQAAVADAVVEAIELDDVDAGNQRVEHVGAARHHRECLLDARLHSAVLESIPFADEMTTGLTLLGGIRTVGPCPEPADGRDNNVVGSAVTATPAAVVVRTKSRRFMSAMVSSLTPKD